jgi:single-strand DNA-binding protein
MNLNNRIHLIGVVSSIPVLKSGQNNTTRLRFTLKTVDTILVNGKKIEDIQYHSVVAWNEIAERNAAKIMKGTEMVVDGRMVKRKFKDSMENWHVVYEVVAETVLIKNPPLWDMQRLKTA